MSNQPWGGPVSGSTDGVSVTAGGIIYQALRKLGVLRSGTGTNAEKLDDGLTDLNQMLDSWNTERLALHAIARDTYALTAGQTSMTLGPSSGARPVRIDAAAILPSGSTVELPIQVITELSRLRSQSGSRLLHCDYAFPEANITISPAANAGDTLVLYTWQQLQGFADLTTQYTFPPGYALALVWNLADQMAPAAQIHTKIAQPLLTKIEREAIRSKAVIKSLNSQPPVMECDPAIGGRGRSFNIFTGSY